jgi:pyrimidine deaminase RibD-like protein
MSHLRDTDRPFLIRACELARAARRPPKKLGGRVEPVWAAVLAGETEIASAAFAPGDAEDAVKRLRQKSLGSEVTLYVTLEPKAGFDRLPPVTESVRLLGVKRVVVGTLDPAQRYRGEGSLTLERMGIEVVLADGEEARLAQHLLEDYSRWLSRGLSVLRARVQLHSLPGGGDLNLSVGEEARLPVNRSDAVLCLAGKKVAPGDSWLVVLDPEGWERPGEKTILYQSEDSAMVPGARKLEFRGGVPDLGALLRDLGSLGILSVELSGDAGLFRQALGSGLIESVLAQFTESSDSLRALSLAGRVQMTDGGDLVELRLGGARLVDEQKRCLEANVELC